MYTVSQGSTAQFDGIYCVSTAIRDELGNLVTRWQWIESDASDILADSLAETLTQISETPKAQSLFNAHIRKLRKAGKVK